MKLIKKSIDPKNIMNPGKIFDIQEILITIEIPQNIRDNSINKLALEIKE